MKNSILKNKNKNIVSKFKQYDLENVITEPVFINFKLSGAIRC